MDNHDLTQVKKVYLIDDESEKHWYVAVSQEQAEGLYLSDFGLDREDLQWSRTTEIPGEDPLDIGYEWEPTHIELSNAIEHGPRDDNWWKYGITKRAADWAAETEVGCLASTLI